MAFALRRLALRASAGASVGAASAGTWRSLGRVGARSRPPAARRPGAPPRRGARVLAEQVASGRQDGRPMWVRHRGVAADGVPQSTGVAHPAGAGRRRGSVLGRLGVPPGRQGRKPRGAADRRGGGGVMRATQVHDGRGRAPPYLAEPVRDASVQTVHRRPRCSGRPTPCSGRTSPRPRPSTCETTLGA